MTWIRATHPYCFRSGQWARISGTTSLPGFPEGDRDCYLVEFADGVTDFWAVDAPGHGYEFAVTPLPPASVLHAREDRVKAAAGGPADAEGLSAAAGLPILQPASPPSRMIPSGRDLA